MFSLAQSQEEEEKKKLLTATGQQQNYHFQHQSHFRAVNCTKRDTIRLLKGCGSYQLRGDPVVDLKTSRGPCRTELGRRTRKDRKIHG